MNRPYHTGAGQRRVFDSRLHATCLGRKFATRPLARIIPLRQKWSPCRRCLQWRQEKTANLPDNLRQFGRRQFEASSPSKRLPLRQLGGIGCEFVRKTERYIPWKRCAPALEGCMDCGRKKIAIEREPPEQNENVVVVLHPAVGHAQGDNRFQLFGNGRLPRISRISGSTPACPSALPPATWYRPGAVTAPAVLS
jgi:hypothetical protein